jgi:hypothetical protein
LGDPPDVATAAAHHDEGIRRFPLLMEDQMPIDVTNLDTPDE